MHTAIEVIEGGRNDYQLKGSCMIYVLEITFDAEVNIFSGHCKVPNCSVFVEADTKKELLLNAALVIQDILELDELPKVVEQ